MDPIVADDNPLQDRRYLLLARIGRGGMADVYRAYDRLDEEVVALKVPREPRAAGPSHPLVAEYERWAGLVHPSIVRARGLAVSTGGPIARGRPYLILEHAGGGAVNRALRPGRIAAGTLLELARQLLDTLGWLHRRGWVHRDVKPANVLCDARRPRRFKLTDFGLASPVGRRGVPGTVSGSLPFVAPECLLGREVDGRTDLYGVGVLLFQLATGRPPAGRTVEDVLRWHLSGPPADPALHRPRLPARFCRLVRRLTRRDPAGRPADGGEALALLGTGPSGEGPQQAAPTDLRQRLRLALDAARLGAWRRIALPCRHRTGGLHDELRGWVTGRGLCGLTLGPGDGPEPVTRMVREWMMARLDATVPAAGRRLGERLPLLWLNGRGPGAPGAAGAPRPTAAAELAELVRGLAARRTVVIVLEGAGGWSDALASALEGLECDAPRNGRGGLLCVVARCAVGDQTCHCTR